MLPAARLGRYEILAKLAAGGMGEIFLARLEGVAGFEKLCVIKRILPHLAGDTRFRQMMIAEAQIVSKMSHANISQIHELDEIDGQLYIVMEYLEGITLLELIRRFAKANEPLDFGLIAGILGQVADGLHYAHELRDRSGTPLNIVHRDVTPSNIFLTDHGVAKVLDFGIAKVENVANTESGAIKGKYAYMAPEQLRGQEVDRRADVFAMGIVLWELLALRRLFQRKTDYLTFRAVMEQPLPDVRQFRRDVPDVLVGVLKRALAAQPEERYGTVRQLRAALFAASPVAAWGDPEIGDFVRAHFAEDIARRGRSIAQVTQRDRRGQTMPVIGGSQDPEPDDDYFAPAVDELASGMGAPPMLVTNAGTTLDQLPRQGGRRNKPPTADDAAMTLPGRPRSPAAPAPAPAPAPTPRSRRWPIVAGLAFLGVATAAIVVWQLQSAPHAKPRPAPPPTTDPYVLALRAHQAALDRCIHDHGTDLPSYARANVFVDAEGKAYDIALEPPSLGNQALATCIHDTLKAITFPAAQDRRQLVLGLAVK